MKSVRTDPRNHAAEGDERTPLDLTLEWSRRIGEWADRYQAQPGYLGNPPDAIIADWLKDGTLVVWARGKCADDLHALLATSKQRVAYPQHRHRARNQSAPTHGGKP